MLLIKSLFRCFCKFVFTDFLTTWVRVEIVMCNSRMVINSIYILSGLFSCEPVWPSGKALVW